jgi:hypothetical protein
MKILGVKIKRVFSLINYISTPFFPELNEKDMPVL